VTIRALVSAHDLAILQMRGDVLIVDCRFDLADPGKGEHDYLDAHVPGAIHADLDRDLSDLSKRGVGRHPLPDDYAFSAMLSRWGWRSDLDVIAYDTANGALAATRLWWLLRVAGHDRVSVLDGGLAAWEQAGFALESGPVQRERSDARVTFDRAQVVWFDELERRREEGSALLIDARAAPRYRGEMEPIDPVAGHVPGALNRPFSENLDASGRFKTSDRLRQEFDALLTGRPAGDVVHMCGSGVTACHNLLAMEVAGLAGSRVFAPSWSGWVSDPSRPVATGTA
jgi:thiosulfate/3-mercaptopyruvate sulfurtransferase